MIKPTKNRVHVLIDDSDETFAGGQLIIARVRDSQGDYPLFPKRGTVLAIGPDVQNLEIGDRVIMTKFNGVELPKSYCDGKQNILIKEDFVLLTIDEGAEVNLGDSFSESLPQRPRRR